MQYGRRKRLKNFARRLGRRKTDDGQGGCPAIANGGNEPSRRNLQSARQAERGGYGCSHGAQSPCYRLKMLVFRLPRRSPAKAVLHHFSLSFLTRPSFLFEVGTPRCGVRGHRSAMSLPRRSVAVLWHQRGEYLFESRIASERIPLRIKFQFAVG